MPTSDNIPREENHRRAHCLSENLRFLLEGNAVSFGRIKCEHSGGDVNPAGNGRTIVFQQAYEFDGWRFLVTVANMKGIGVEFGDMTEFGKCQ